MLVNNAGVTKASPFIGAPSLDAARLEMETNYFGTLSMCRAFAPVLAAAGGGAIVNMLSEFSFYPYPLDPSYGASKAAERSLTNGIWMELSGQGTLVVAVHASFIDTDMAAGLDVPKISPESVARQAFDAVEAGGIEVLADERSRFVKASLPRDHELIYGPLQQIFSPRSRAPAQPPSPAGPGQPFCRFAPPASGDAGRWLDWSGEGSGLVCVG